MIGCLSLTPSCGPDPQLCTWIMYLWTNLIFSIEMAPLFHKKTLLAGQMGIIYVSSWLGSSKMFFFLFLLNLVHNQIVWLWKFEGGWQLHVILTHFSLHLSSFIFLTFLIVSKELPISRQAPVSAEREHQICFCQRCAFCALCVTKHLPYRRNSASWNPFYYPFKK